MAITRILSAFRPTRASRRANAGARCSLCERGITAPDFALVELEYDGVRKVTEPIHTQCTGLLGELAEALINDAEAEDPQPE